MFNYTSYESGGDSDTELNVKTIGSPMMGQTLQIQPTISYFLQPNLSIDAIFSLTKQMDDDDDEYSQNGLGVSFTHYLNQNIYIGLGYLSMTSKYDSGDVEFDYSSEKIYNRLSNSLKI